MTFFFHNADDTRRATHDARRDAFTLIETALALFAISLGLLGIFGLARHGLKNGADTEAETRCTLLADTVFETLKSKNDELIARHVSFHDWWAFWALYASNNGQVSIYLPAMLEISQNSGRLLLSSLNSEKQHTLHQLTSAEFSPEVKWAPLYDIQLTTPDPDSPETPIFVESLSETKITKLLGCMQDITIKLRIHPGLLQSGADERTYYATLTYAGGLP
jgi:Tfp pilus assembly protein PilV